MAETVSQRVSQHLDIHLQGLALASGTADNEVRPGQETRERILDAAETAFMQHGFDGASMRTITATAGVNLAAANYHFGSKEGLLCAVFRRRLEGLNRERLAVLDDLEAQSGGAPLKPSQILEAFFGTLLRIGEDEGRGGVTFLRLLGRTLTDPADFIRDFFAREYAEGILKADYWQSYVEDSLNLTAKLPGLAALCRSRRSAKASRTAVVAMTTASGVSGAGRPPKPTTTFCAVDEDFTAYGLLDHRHTPEIEQNLTHAAGADVQVLFTPHLAPMNRGILATCYARPTATTTTAHLRDVLHRAYDAEPFVVVRHDPPSTKATLGSNAVHVTAYADERTGWVVALAALDNLTKGASGGAIQAANVALGLPEQAGLPTVGLYP